MVQHMLCYPNRIDSASLSGGSWTAGLPRANLQDRKLGKVARTADAALASTKFDIDLGRTRNVRMLSLIKHTISLAGRRRVRVGNDNTFAATLFDSAWGDVWPVVYPVNSLEWSDDNWWSGKYTSEQIAGYNAAMTVILPASVVARYVRVEIDDTTNATGYLDIGRAFVGPGWVPTNNMSYGATIGWSTKTEVEEALGGAEYFNRKVPFRIQRIPLDWLSEDEGMANAFEIDRLAGIDEEVFWIYDINDTVHALRRQFLGRLQELSPIDNPYFDVNRQTKVIKEIL